jgi:ADP-ribose pyrophosphatase YjhB (NUDIX family)
LYPDKPEVGVGAVVIDEDNNILLIKRVNPPGEGKYSVPGGHLNLGESIYDAAIRELREETGIEGEPIGIINIDEYVEYERDRIRYHYVLIDVLIRPKTPLNKAVARSDAKEILVLKLEDSLRVNLTKSVRSLITKMVNGKTVLLDSNFIESR